MIIGFNPSNRKPLWHHPGSFGKRDLTIHLALLDQVFHAERSVKTMQQDTGRYSVGRGVLIHR